MCLAYALTDIGASRRLAINCPLERSGLYGQVVKSQKGKVPADFRSRNFYYACTFLRL